MKRGERRPSVELSPFRNIKSGHCAGSRYHRSSMRILDTRTGYGWISIALHWLTAIVILTLWFIGSSIQSDLATGSTSTLRLHTSIAITAYVLLWARVIWRFKFGHPDATPEQRGLFY